MAARKNQYISPAMWEAIRNEYITSDISTRDIAKKYGICVATVYKHSGREKWVERRIEHETKINEAVERRYSEATIQASANAVVEGITKLQETTSLALDKVSEALAACNPTNKEDRQVMRSLVAALKDIREIQGEKSQLDIQEQQARIAKLRRETEEESNNSEIRVIIQGDLEEYSK